MTDLNEIKKMRKMYRDSCDVEAYSCKTFPQYIDTCLHIDFLACIETVEKVFEVLGIKADMIDNLENAMLSVADLISQIYEADCVNDMLDRGFLYENGSFTDGDIKLNFKDVMYHDLDQAIAMGKQLKEIQDLDEKDS